MMKVRHELAALLLVHDELSTIRLVHEYLYFADFWN